MHSSSLLLGKAATNCVIGHFCQGLIFIMTYEGKAMDFSNSAALCYMRLRQWKYSYFAGSTIWLEIKTMRLVCTFLSGSVNITQIIVL